MLTPFGSPSLPFLFPLVNSFAHTRVNQASSRDHALQGKCVQVQRDLQVLSSSILRSQTHGTVSEASELNWIFLLLRITFLVSPQ